MNTSLNPAGRHDRQRHHRAGRLQLAGPLARTVVAVLAGLLLGAARADAAPTPAPTSPVTDPVCAAKAPGSVAWCMPWAVRVDKPAAGGRSHWVTACSKATSDADRTSCVAASITLNPSPKDGTASVLMDGPSIGSGPAGLINCGLQRDPFGGGANPNPSWDLKRSACNLEIATWSKQMFDPDPKPADCPLTDLNCKVQRDAQQALANGISAGFQGLVDAAVQGTVWLLSKLAAWVFKITTISTPDAAFYATYNSLAGVLIGLVFVFFILSTVINGLRTTAGPGPVATLGGLVRAVLGVTFAAGIAYTIVAAWDQATNAVIAANARTPYDPSWLVTSFSKLTDGTGTLFIAFLLAVLATFGLLLLFVLMLFRGLLATGAALFGAMAMTGQVQAETRHWGRRWFWTVNALGSSKFFIAELWIYGSRSAYGSENVMNALRGVLLIWLMVAAPWILMRLTTLWDGYLSDVNAHAMLSTAGNPLQLGADFVDGARAGAAGAGGGGSPASGAAGVMDENTAGMPTTPLGATEGAAGIGSGTGRQEADAASTGGDGERVGQPAGDAEAGQEQAGGADSPNAEEADGIESGARSAQHDISTGQLTAPGDATGTNGSLPVTPGAAQSSDPTGGMVAHSGTPGAAPAAGGTDTGSDATGSGGDGAAPGPSTGAANPASGDSSGADSSASHGTADDDGSPQGERSSGAGQGSAGSGGVQEAATTAAEVPIV